MKIDRILLSSALIATMALPSIVNAGMDFEISGVAKNETSVYTKKASETNRVGQKHEDGDLMKVESSLNLFINSSLVIFHPFIFNFKRSNYYASFLISFAKFSISVVILKNSFSN